MDGIQDPTAEVAFPLEDCFEGGLCQLSLSGSLRNSTSRPPLQLIEGCLFLESKLGLDLTVTIRDSGIGESIIRTSVYDKDREVLLMSSRIT